MENIKRINEKAEDYMPDTHQMHKMDTNEQPYQIQAIPTIQNVAKQEIKFDKEQEKLTEQRDLDQQEELYQQEIHKANEMRIVLDNDLKQLKKKKYQCVICQAWLSRKSHLDRHYYLKHTHEKKFKCEWPDCGKAFKQQIELNTHERVHIGQDCFSCDVCNKSFTRSYTLNCHMRIHTGIGLFKCDSCTQSFTTSTQLNRHIKLHHTKREKSFKCDLCEQSYITDKQLLRHKRNHERGLVYKCKYCDESFICQRDQISHHRTHTGALPPKCDVCKKEFNQIRDLRTHKLRYHNITMKMRTYERTKCDICHKKIRGNRSLKRHKKVAHGIMKKILPNPQDLKCEKELTDEEKNAMQGKALSPLKAKDTLEANANDMEISCSMELDDQSFVIILHLTSNSKKFKLKKNTKSVGKAVEDYINSEVMKRVNNHLMQDKASQMEADNPSEYYKNFYPNEYEPNKYESGIQDNSETNEKSRLHCYVCDIRFSTSKALLKHEYLHTGVMPFCCGVCNLYFPFQSELDRHNKSLKHINAMEYTLDAQLQEGDDEYEAKYDIYNHIDGTNHEEDIKNVDMDFKPDHFIPKYESIKQESDFIGCGEDDINPHQIIGDNNQKNRSKYADCYQELDNGRIQCKLCDQTLSSLNIFYKHIKTHTAPPSHHCKICNKSYWRRQQFNVHNKSVMHARRLKELQNESARKIRINDEALRVDVQLQLDNNLSKIIPLDKTKKGRQCHICGERFNSSKSLRKHEFIHTGKMPFHCGLCDQYFPFNSDFNRHKESLKHLNAVKYDGKDLPEDDSIKRFKCTMCDSLFKNARDRINHEALQHTGTYPYNCDVCDQNFRFNSELKSHNESQRHLNKVNYLSDVNADDRNDSTTAVNPLDDTEIQNNEEYNEDSTDLNLLGDTEKENNEEDHENSTDLNPLDDAEIQNNEEYNEDSTDLNPLGDTEIDNNEEDHGDSTAVNPLGDAEIQNNEEDKEDFADVNPLGDTDFDE